MQPLQRRLRAEDYRPLADYLAAHTAPTVTLTLVEIEALLGKQLPPCARDRSRWLRRAPQEGYRRLVTPLGWTVDAVHRRRVVQAITFVRAEREGPG